MPIELVSYFFLIALVKNSNKMTDKRSQPQIPNGDILLTYTGLLCQGKTEFEAVKEMEEDPEYYIMALGIQKDIPSCETLRLDCQQISGQFLAFR